MLNKHDIDNFKQGWKRFWVLSMFGEYNKQWGFFIGLLSASVIYYAIR